MDYEKKIREYMASSEVDQLYKSMLINLFPELAESEGEKIRKHIIEILRRLAPCQFDGNERSECIAWLEKQGEQKPVEEIKGNNGEISPNLKWSEEDETKLNDVIRLIENSGHVESIRKHYIDWLKSLRPQEQQYDDEWSDEDKEFLKLTLSNLTELKDRYGEGYGRVGECIKWLNSLQPQPIDVEAAIAYQEGYQKAELEFYQKQQEWTDEDINMIDWLIRCCEKEHEELCNDRYGHQDIVSDLKRDCRKKWDWFESLKGKVAPQKLSNMERNGKNWKPSDEQMKCLREIVKDLQVKHETSVGGFASYSVLNSLYEQLKEL